METSVHDLMEEIRRRIQVSVDVGESARFELIRAETEVLSAANRMEAAHLNAERARVALIQLTAGALPKDFEINASLSDPVDFPSLEILRGEVPNINPEIIRLEAEQNRARLQIDQARASVLPSLNVLFSNYQDAQFSSNTAGVSVQIPIFIVDAVKLTAQFLSPHVCERLSIIVALKSASSLSLLGKLCKLHNAELICLKAALSLKPSWR